MPVGLGRVTVSQWDKEVGQLTSGTRGLGGEPVGLGGGTVRQVVPVGLGGGNQWD